MSGSVSLASDALVAPRLPLELFALVIGNLTDNSDLLRCSLVCRGWLPFSRGRLRLFIHEDTRLKHLLESPENTLASTIRHLSLSNVDPLIPSWHLSPDSVPCSPSNYLRDSGSNLEALQLMDLDDETLSKYNVTLDLDFSANVNLRRLSIDQALHFKADTSEIRVCPMLLSLLSNVGRHARLQVLDLHIASLEAAYGDTALWLPPSQLQTLLRTDHFASLRTIRFVSTRHHAPDGDAWPSVKAALQASLPDSRVIYDF
ncbi:hypothetical protein FB45DRAFT_1066383 [Roridomyces roridus]|uniref:F-box domain-containing protein n=1 Tax=Roridomyces roridus TaxID=1738132 RepID=A0AAD7B4C4_9AGAR|nr:hypothetical protein FB45DRAFT_1066383 [Roridomyces roridus]